MTDLQNLMLDRWNERLTLLETSFENDLRVAVRDFFEEYQLAKTSPAHVEETARERRLLQHAMCSIFRNLSKKERAKASRYVEVLLPFVVRGILNADVLTALEEVDGHACFDRDALAKRQHAAVGLSKLEIICDDEMAARVLETCLLDRLLLQVIRVDDGSFDWKEFALQSIEEVENCRFVPATGEIIGDLKNL